MTDIYLVYVTTKDAAQARTIGHTVVSEKLAACANILPVMESIYEWQGEIQTESEAVLILKTTKACLAPLTARIEELHSYEIPALVALPVSQGAERFLQWIGAQTAK